MSDRFSLLTPLGLGLVVTAALAGYTGCKKDEPPPPLPSAAPAPTPTPTEPLTLVPEDAGAPLDAGDDADAGKRGGSGQSMAKCCAALASNAALAPSPNKEYMLAAAQACNVAVGAGQGNAAVMSAVQGALRGAGMPAACK
jgi:hypothetical protein